MTTEELLRKHARIAGEAMLDALPAPEDCSHQFSRRFQRKMRPLIRRQALPAKHRALCRAAALIPALLLGAIIWLAVNQDTLSAIFQWLRARRAHRILYKTE